MNRIDALRKAKSMSYEDIGKAAGFSPYYIWLLAKEKRKNPSLNAMKKISEALGERVEKVFNMN